MCVMVKLYTAWLPHRISLSRHLRKCFEDMGVEGRRQDKSVWNFITLGSRYTFFNIMKTCPSPNRNSLINSAELYTCYTCTTNFIYTAMFTNFICQFKCYCEILSYTCIVTD